jgi:hypothetical protein
MDHFEARGLAALPFVLSLFAPQHGAFSASSWAGQMARACARHIRSSGTQFAFGGVSAAGLRL